MSVDPWGKRKLAYEIDHPADAFYYVLTFDAPVPRRSTRRHACSRSPTACCATWPLHPHPKADAGSAARAGRSAG